MSYISTDRDELTRRGTLALHRFTTLAQEVDPQTRIRGSEWTAKQVVAHVLSVLHRYNDRDLHSWDGLSATPAELNEQNDKELAALEPMSVDELVSGVRTEFERWLAISEGLDQAASYKFHFRQTIDGNGGAGNMLGELLVHGFDIARSAGRSWEIDDRDAQLVFNGVLQVANGALDPVALRGLDLSVLWRIGDRATMLHVVDGQGGFIDPADGPARPDVVIGGPPAPMLLSLYGRVGPLAAARRGVFVRGGRRPWRAAKIESLFLR
ncbi:maleylpyruvate isomerase N-terminal domain-containing protein [Nocardioides stalactiti]|uniref:maleylpyruvate isomerase N-terminal domain-containing protein n=1 Tax=Nocardioides stalactiti TaxID=2755356 RepID=UPI0016030895|nr:maleylpyruvate isomerase N-terminal domain-containing protein [Nocardioides stalactiti]